MGGVEWLQPPRVQAGPLLWLVQSRHPGMSCISGWEKGSPRLYRISTCISIFPEMLGGLEIQDISTEIQTLKTDVIGAIAHIIK